MRFFVSLIGLIIVGFAQCKAQELIVEKAPEPIYNNVYASKNPVMDENGGYCGVVFVHSTIDGLRFKESVGAVEKNNTTYNVYVSSDTKKLTVISSLGVVEVKLPPIAPKSATQLTLGTDYSYGAIALTTVPSGAKVYIAKSPFEKELLGTTPLKGQVKVPIGRKKLIIQKSGYEDKTIENVNVKKDKITKLGKVKLTPQ